MRVEEMALRSEIRQMLNEAGFNKETIKILVKEALQQEIRKIADQAIAESNTDMDSYIRSNLGKMVNKAVDNSVEKIITQSVVGRYFDCMSVSVKVTPIMDLIDKEGDNND